MADRCRSQPFALPTHLLRGKEAELLAASHLEQIGYVILDRNFRCRQGELDIVACHNDTIVFVEVRARQSVEQGQPFESVNSKKQRRICRAAQHWLQQHDRTRSFCRFDVVSVVFLEGAPPSIEVIENAFEAVEG